MSDRSRAILRVRTGCLTCRGRKKKCDEQKPRCRGCARNHLECLWPTHGGRISRRGERRLDTGITDPTTPPTTGSTSDGRSDPDVDDEGAQQPHDHLTSPVQIQQQRTSRPDPETYPAANDGIELGPEFVLRDDYDFTLAILPSIDTPQSLTSNPSVFPQLNHASFGLLSHYLAKTANSMGNGSTDANPFLTQLVPLAFSSELILHLILTQSAAQRAVMGPDSAQIVANDYYTKSLGLFRNAVNDFVCGNRADGLMLATGALILCFTETTKGDIHGAVFDHLAAAHSILRSVIGSTDFFAMKALSNFLVEYYTYTATMSMISVDARYSEQLLLASDMEQSAQELAKSAYVGHLCGTWLELLLLIPRIFELGRRILVAYDASTSATLSADDVLAFSELHHDIMSFNPSATVPAETYEAGHVFQKAVLLYLLTTMKPNRSRFGGKHENAISLAVADAIFHLSQINPTARVNTSLCWPLAVIGSCTEDETTQSIIRDRLHTMLRTITLGNIKVTLVLLEHIWAIPLEQRSPWTICSTMQEHELWISFA